MGVSVSVKQSMSCKIKDAYLLYLSSICYI